MKLHQTLRLEEEYIEAATKYAETENRTLSNVYETAIIQYLSAVGAIRKKSIQTKKKKYGVINFTP